MCRHALARQTCFVCTVVHIASLYYNGLQYKHISMCIALCIIYVHPYVQYAHRDAHTKAHRKLTSFLAKGKEAGV
jgi:hypothetical protein